MRKPALRTPCPSRGIPIALAALTVGACHVVEAKTWNLSQLHSPEGRHQYRGALQSDFEYFLRHRVASLLTVTGARIAEKDPEAIENPSEECLENLLDLECFDASDPRVSGRQVEWFARLAVEDPYRLSRERSTLALGRAGARLEAGIPASLGRDETAAGAEALSTALAELVAGFRRVLESGARASETAELDLAAACDVVRGQPLDLDGARRALRVSTDLARAAGLENTKFEPLRRLETDLQRLCVRRALAAAVLDRDPIVRAAAIEAAVVGAGNAALMPILVNLGHETAPEVLTRVLDLIADYGLPEPPPELSEAERAEQRERWLGTMYSLIGLGAGGEVRVAAMSALASVSGAGLTSLREEDWQRWWQDRQEARARDAGEAPLNEDGRGS